MSITYKSVLAVILLALCACSRITPMAYEEVLEESDRLLERAYLGQEDVNKPVTLYEAYARALSYNLDYRMANLKDVLAQQEMEFSRFSLIPQLSGEGIWTRRDREYASVSEPTEFTENELNLLSLGLPINRQTATPSTSSEREGTNYNFTLQWNSLDYSVAWFRSRQHGYDRLAAHEEKRRVMQNIISEVTRAYWEASAAQRYDEELDSIISEVRAALKTARLLQSRKLKNMDEGLQYQRGLIKTLQQLNARKTILVQAKHRLASLINIPKGVEFTVDNNMDPPDNFYLGSLSDQELKKLALSQRPEVLQQFYEMEIGEYGEKIERWRLLPNIGAKAVGYYDSNQYLVHNKWAQGSASIALNLVKLASYPKRLKISELKREAQETRMQALMVAVLSQSEISKQNFLDSLESYCLAKELSEVEQRRLAQYEARIKVRSGYDLELIRARVDNLLVNLERANQYAVLQGSYSLLMKTIGMDPVPYLVPSYDLGELSDSFQHYFEDELPERMQDSLKLLEEVELVTPKSSEAQTRLTCG